MLEQRLPGSRYLARLLRLNAAEEFLKNPYFLLGLALQKGTPFLTLPLTVAVVGAKVYGDYVLLFSVVQVVGVVCGAALPQALIPFWYERQDKEEFVTTLSLVMLGLQIPLSIAAGTILYLTPTSTLTLGRFVIPVILVYALIYNLNFLALNLVRAQCKQVTFFWSTLFTSCLFVAMLLLLRYAHHDLLLAYTALNLLTMCAQTWCYFHYSQGISVRVIRGQALRTFIRQMLTFSLPLSVYTLVVLSGLVVDKWTVKYFFNTVTFSQYILDCQFAFSITLVSLVIGMYNMQKQCELVFSRAFIELRRNVLGNYVVSILGSVVLALGSYTYAHIGRVHLSVGYWVLALGFTVSNCYAVNSSALTAQRRSALIAWIGGTATLVFTGALLLCGMCRMIRGVYVACLGYELSLFVLSGAGILALLRREEGTRGVLVGSSIGAGLG